MSKGQLNARGTAFAVSSFERLEHLQRQLSLSQRRALEPRSTMPPRGRSEEARVAPLSERISGVLYQDEGTSKDAAHRRSFNRNEQLPVEKSIAFSAFFVDV